jgi:hypothetical protein
VVCVTRLEELLRESLADPRRRIEPPAGHFERVSEKIDRARRRRASRSFGAVAGAVVLVVVAGLLIGAHRPGTAQKPAGVPPVSSTPTRYAPQPQRYTVGKGQPADLVAYGDSVYLTETQPDTLLRLDPRSLEVTGSAALPDQPGGIVADPARGLIWVWYLDATDRTVLLGYPAGNLAGSHRTVRVDVSVVWAVAALNGELWLTTEKGLYRVPVGATRAARVGAFGGETFTGKPLNAVAADPTRNRVLVDEADTGSGTRPVALYPGTSTSVGGEYGKLGKEELVVVAGQIWIGGYASDGGPRLVHLDPDTLRPRGGSPVEAQLGPGAIVYPGSSVLWVRNGGDEGLSCVDPATGAVLEQWASVQGPVASVPGAAVAIDGWFLLRPQLSGRCAG